MFSRHLNQKILDALADTPVVLLNGARQTGKSTLVQSLPNRTPAYYSLDDHTIRSAALQDPQGFIEHLPEQIILDEIQLAPELFRAIKLAVDRKRTPGRFLLTGSANVLLLPQLSESLAGRMELLTLWPLSQGEICGIRENFIDVLFTKPVLHTVNTKFELPQLHEQLITGGYPEVVTRTSVARRTAWFESYLTTLLQRDIRELANISGLLELPKLINLLAARAAQLINYAELSRSAMLPQTTLKRYLSLFEMTYLIYYLSPWSTNLSKRLVKSPKVYFTDTGLLCHCLGVDAQQLKHNSHLLGKILENFIVMEIVKQITWSETSVRLYHFRTQTGHEVDLVLENAQGQIIGIEIKSSASVSNSDFKGLHAFADLTDKKFHSGIVLYCGQQAVAFGKNLFAYPIHSLWQKF